MSKETLLVGIDPGTTCGYALLNHRGEIVLLNSSKDTGLTSLLQIICAKGHPLLVATDKAKAPELVLQFARKNGAKLFCPSVDLGVDEKKQLTKRSSYRNSHERDALASALFSYQKHRNLIERIQKYITEHSLQSVETELFRNVLVHSLSLHDAHDLLTKPQHEIIRKSIKEHPQDPTLIQLYKRMQLIKKENKQLHFSQKSMSSRIKQLEKRNSVLEKQLKKSQTLSQKKIDMLFSFKDNRLHSLQKEIEAQHKHNQLTLAELEKIQQLLLNHEQYLILKKLPHLQKIPSDQYLYVSNPNLFTDEYELEDKIIICDTKPKNTTSATYLLATELKPIIISGMAFFDKQKVQEKLNSTWHLQNLVTKYQQRLNH